MIMFIGCINHSQMGGLWHCFSYISFHPKNSMVPLPCRDFDIMAETLPISKAYAGYGSNPGEPVFTPKCLVNGCSST